MTSSSFSSLTTLVLELSTECVCVCMCANAQVCDKQKETELTKLPHTIMDVVAQNMQDRLAVWRPREKLLQSKPKATCWQNSFLLREKGQSWF